MSHPPLTHIFSCPLSLILPVWPECQWCQGASVCNVTTVIVKQRAQGGPLLRYSQKAVGCGEDLVYCNTLPASPHLLLSPPPLRI